MNALKIALGVFVYLATAAVIACAAAFFWLAHEYSKAGPVQTETFFTAERGQGVSQIADNLEAQNIISSALAFKAAMRLVHAGETLKAGEYQLSPSLSMREIADKMIAGDIYIRKVTIPEGLTSYEIIELLKTVADLSGDVPSVPTEGTLLPETYIYTRSEPRLDVVEEMQANMTKTIDELWPGRDPDLPFATKTQAVILASIVEKETGVPEERKRVAAVFINRLRKGIALQTDPTVIYALTQGRNQNNGQGPLGRRLLVSDLTVDSPYNTYRNVGLPPGPIANPGRASIEAVLHPEINNYLYFVADGTGGHIFSETLQEHNANVAKWRKIRRDRKN